MGEHDPGSEVLEPQAAAPPPAHAARLQLVWDVVLFQFKLAADGLRDLALSPFAILAAVMGLLVGGDDPHRYFRRVLRFGRRSEAWINLFGHRRRGTSDDLVDPLREQVFSRAASNRWLNRAGTRFNEKLDEVNAARSQRGQSDRDSS